MITKRTFGQLAIAVAAATLFTTAMAADVTVAYITNGNTNEGWTLINGGAKKAGQTKGVKFIELAADINDQMAAYAIARMQDILNERSISLRGARILCLGAAFKSGVSDVRNSRAIHVMELLRERGAVVSYCDPHVPSVRVGAEVLQSINVGDVNGSDADLVAVLVGGQWPLAALANRGVTVFDAVNAGGAPGEHRQRL